MAITQVTWLQAETYQALDARLSLTAQLGPPTTAATSLTRPGGVLPGFAGGLAVTATTPSASMTTNIAAGAASIPNSSSAQGNYLLVNDANMTVTHAANGSGSARVDLVIARVYDLGSSSSNGAIEIVQGTAGAGVPAMPAGGHALKLAEVTVAAGAGSVPQGNIVDRRTWSVGLGGIQPALSTARPTNAYGGMTIWETDTNALSVWSATASAWRSISTEPTSAWTAYTPAWTASTTNPTLGGSSIQGRYSKNGRTVSFSATLNIGAAGGFGIGAGTYRISLPQPAAVVSNMRWLVHAHLFDTSGNGATEASKQWVGNGLIVSGGSTVSEIRLGTCDPTNANRGGIWTHTEPVQLTTGDNMTITGTYETAN